MRYASAAFVTGVALWSASATAAVLENGELAVTVDRDTARITVLHKPTGVVWEQENPAARAALEEKVRVRRAGGAVTVDGSDAEWPREDTIWLPWVGTDGERNLSGGARLMWDDDALYLYVRVRDDRVAFGDPATAGWWEADSVEFWVDTVQVGLHLHPDARLAVDARGTPFDGARVALREIRDDRLPGYAVEVAMPVRHLPVLAGPAEGVRFFFAVGLNDADPEPGRPVRRVAQGYYPNTWAHSQPQTFAVAVLADRAGTARALTKELDRTSMLVGAGVTGMRAGRRANSVTYALTVTRGQGAPLPLAVEIALVGDEPALDVTLGCPTGASTPLRRLEYPPPLFPPTSDGWFMAMAEYSDGRYVPVTDELYRGRQFSTSSSLDMPFVAVTDGTQGMVAIAMTPADAIIRMQPRSGDATKAGFPGFAWEPSKGAFAADRRARLAFFATGGHVAACKIYRRIAEQAGYVRTLEAKAAANPDVSKLMGAVNWWGADGLSFVRQAVAEGMRHGLVNGRWNPDDMRRIVELGWLVGEYDNYVDIDDSPVIDRAKAPVKDHAVVLPGGEFMTAWVTRDKDMNPVHTYMKHCTARQLECAKVVIPKVLAEYPYNARFLDVTPAEELRECHSPTHPVDRSADMVNRQMLCRYVCDELKLIAGGEHGRFWSVPYLHYHEGMMGGGHYSWEAGYLRDVERRDQLSERYLTYGINPSHLAPLFELVFHDCVVDYWYWGACNDYLHAVAPEITDRTTAMNVLYGTPPMMWANSHGLRWQDPGERELMLAIYRTVCRLHETIGMQELVSHEFLAPDRMVQRSTFADGTRCTVNFGTAPHRVTRDGGARETLTLGENDFYVHGPRIEQWRLPAGADLATGAPRTTFVCSDGYLFAEAGATRFQTESIGCTGTVTVAVEDDAHARIVLAPRTNVDLRVPQWRSSWRDRPRVLLLTDAAGTPVERCGGGDAPDLTLRNPTDAKARYLLLAGDAALVPDVTIAGLAATVAGASVEAGTPLDALDTVRVELELVNRGLAAAGQMDVVVRLDGPEGPELFRAAGVALRPGERRRFTHEFPARRADGPRALVARVESPRSVSLTGRTETRAYFTGPLVMAEFPFRRRYELALPPGECGGMPVEVPFDLRGPDGRAADPLNLRARFADGAVAPAQFEPRGPGEPTGTLVFCVPMSAGRDGARVAVDILGAPAGTTGVAPHASRFDVAADGTRIRMGTYAARIALGVLGPVEVFDDAGRACPVLESIVVSCKETGWVGETGPVEEFTCVARGPVRSVFACRKKVSGTYALSRRWLFYADRIEVHTACEPRIGTLTRARYVSPGTATNATGRSARMDGAGEGEGFGFQGTPAWYAVFGPSYRTACIALTPPGGFTWWDSGALGQAALDHGRDGIEKRVYLWGPGAADDAFARETARACARGIEVRAAE